MKVILPLISFILLLTCGSPSKPILKISTGIKNNKVVWGDTLQLKLKDKIENKKSNRRTLINQSEEQTARAKSWENTFEILNSIQEDPQM